jgi:hypothetical protein
MSAPRRWKIGKAIYAYTDETTWEGPDLAGDETVEVIELEPLLDLLQQAEATLMVGHVVHAFLREHGRS